MNKSIIHFAQPHTPYLHPDFEPFREAVARKNVKVVSDNEEDKKTVLEKFRDEIGAIVEKVIGFEKTYNLRYKLGLNQKTNDYWFDLLEKYSPSDLKKFYEYNLRYTLEQVSNLVYDLDGKIIITADHGECFGEKGLWGHPIVTHIPELIEVPWFEVKG